MEEVCGFPIPSKRLSFHTLCGLGRFGTILAKTKAAALSGGCKKCIQTPKSGKDSVIDVRRSRKDSGTAPWPNRHRSNNPGLFFFVDSE